MSNVPETLQCCVSSDWEWLVGGASEGERNVYTRASLCLYNILTAVIQLVILLRLTAAAGFVNVFLPPSLFHFVELIILLH